jgi:murein L,D-transpeptidase YafK
MSKTSLETMQPRTQAGRRLVRYALSGAFAALLLSGCTSASLEDIGPPTDITPKLAREIRSKGFTEQAPILVRIFKEESELEIWKKKSSGEYALFKTYPICRWSGKLGPKRNSGDRQAPEGFYTVSMGQLNPRSKYYLSFNLGYPNRLEQALGHQGEALMVHGACSSSGCYAMTDQGVADIYAIALKALESGQRQFQVQAFPFRMTAANMARHGGNPNMSFWQDLKTGYDSFETRRREPAVAYCGGRYVIDKAFAAGAPEDPLASCPADAATSQLMAAARSTETMSLSPAPQAHAYSYVDGGMHPSFRAMLKQYGPERMAKRVSTIKYPISRPEAALADPFKP